MYYENSLTVTLKNEKTAAAALKIMKARLIAGFDCDKGYKRVPSMLMHDTLEVEKKTGWNTFRTLGQELAASALWKDL